MIAPIRYSYGGHPSQFGELTVPGRGRPAPWPVAILVHGGFWRLPRTLDMMVLLAHDLVARGYATWNLEYRRVGDGGGWPSTYQDVADGIDYLADPSVTRSLDLSRAVIIGHSAGGHLALWAAGCPRLSGRSTGVTPRIQPIAAVSLAGIPDLAEAATLKLGDGAVVELMQGRPDAHPDRYMAASLQPSVPQVLIHGSDDTVVPIDLVRSYVNGTHMGRTEIELVEIPDEDHLSVINPLSRSWRVASNWIEKTLGEPKVR